MPAKSSAPDAPTLCWSTGRTRTTATWQPVVDQKWSTFVQWLKLNEPAASKEVRPYVGGTLRHGRRTHRTVEQRFFLTLDADYAEADFDLEVGVLLHDVPHVIHTTWRHTDDAHRYRLIIPLDRGVTPNEYKELAWMVMHRLGGDQFDKTTAQAERFMWGPSTQDPDTYHATSANPRAPYLPVDTWLDGQHSTSQSPAAGGQANHPPAKPATGSGAHSAPQPTEEDIERAEEILADAVDDVLHLHERDKFAGRNDAVFHLMPTLLRFAEAGALDEELVLDTLFSAAQQVPSDEPYTLQEFQASVRSARAYAEESGPALPETTRTKMAVADFEDVEDPDDEEDLWTASPQLRHVAQAADNIGCNRSALLAATLTRILVQIDPDILLAGSEDGSVGSRAALNLGVVLVGSSGQGKTTIQEKSDELVPGTQRFEAKPSTGQGLIQAYLEQGEGEELQLKSEPKCLWLFDEIDTLAATAADKTSTLLSEVRTMLTGGMTGTKNATLSRQRHLPKRSYNFQMIVNSQPSRAGVLLDDRDGGTPQRFIWAAVNDPARVLHVKDRPPWPGPLNWSDVFTLMFAAGKPVVDIPQWLKDELLDYDFKVRQEGIEGGPLSRNSHKNLLRLKVATGIAFLHESHIIEDWHVHLADIVLKSSYRVQKECEKIIAKTEFNAKMAKVRSDSRVVELVGDEKLKHLTEIAITKLKRNDDWVAWKVLRPQYQDRHAWEEPLWEALERDDNVKTEETEKPYGTEVRKSRKARWIG